MGACDSSSSGGTSGGSIAFSNLPTELAKTFCATAGTCLGPLIDTLLNVSDCETFLTRRFEEGDFSLIQAAIDDGRVNYDPTKAPACLDAIQNAGCGFFGKRLSLLCADALSGTLSGGSQCTLNAECGTGLFCKLDTQCPGACTPFLSAGMSCTKDDECGDGLTCSDTNVCQAASSFQVSAAVGEACNPEQAEFCQSGLVCALDGQDPVAPWKCEQPATGTDCHIAFPEWCPSGQFCELQQGAVTGSCVAMPQIGSACGSRYPDDQGGVCPADSVCSGRSITPTTSVLGTCKAYAMTGSPCADDTECYSEHCVSGNCAASECAP